MGKARQAGLSAERIYTGLCWHGTAAGTDLFDMHVTACLLAIAMREAERESLPLSDSIGLSGRELRALFVMMFPDALFLLDGSDAGEPAIAEEESTLRDILWMHSADASPFERLLCAMIARRSLRPNHLWQDLGLGNRSELSKLMRRHFPRLAERNHRDMKWKKFFYRMMCSSTGYSLCLSPVCSECDDYQNCFGPEDGASLLSTLSPVEPGP